MRDFNLELAKQGHPVCTRDGRKVRILATDVKSEKPIVAVVDYEDSAYPCEIVETYCANGKCNLTNIECNADLMLASTKHEGWVNVYRDKGYHVDKEIWEFEENAIGIGKEFPDYVATVKIEWED